MDYIIPQPYNNINLILYHSYMGGFVKMDGRKDYRVEMDSVGAKDVPENVYYGVQSMRAAENFQITGLNMHPEIIDRKSVV